MKQQRVVDFELCSHHVITSRVFSVDDIVTFETVSFFRMCEDFHFFPNAFLFTQTIHQNNFECVISQ